MFSLRCHGPSNWRTFTNKRRLILTVPINERRHRHPGPRPRCNRYTCWFGNDSGHGSIDSYQRSYTISSPSAFFLFTTFFSHLVPRILISRLQGSDHYARFDPGHLLSALSFRGEAEVLYGVFSKREVENVVPPRSGKQMRTADIFLNAIYSQHSFAIDLFSSFHSSRGRGEEGWLNKLTEEKLRDPPRYVLSLSLSLSLRPTCGYWNSTRFFFCPGGGELHIEFSVTWMCLQTNFLS